MIKVLHFDVHEVVAYIDWSYFFHAWGLPAWTAGIARVHDCEACKAAWTGSFSIKDQPKAIEAMKLYAEAKRVLAEAEGRVRTHAVVGLLEANSQGDDIIVSHNGKEQRIPFLRQQTAGSNGYCLCMSDFIRPKEKGPDRIGIFACSTDKEMEETYAEDEYRHLLQQTIADRLAEATAERMHEMVRKDLWGYAPDENLQPEELFLEKYAGKRPAVGYPSIPDQSICFLIDRILNLQQIGISLTESGAMKPHASTCGFLFSHPETTHFSVGKVEEDQLRDYARRRGMAYEDMIKYIR